MPVQCGECPGINAFHCEGRGWVLSADEVNKIEFRGTHANIRYRLPRFGPAAFGCQRTAQPCTMRAEP